MTGYDIRYWNNGSNSDRGLLTDQCDELTYAGAMDFKDGVNEQVEYTWDANGNMTSDLNKGLIEIKYNVLNLPEKITHSDGHVTYLSYAADGRKLRVTYKINPFAAIGDPVINPGEPVDPIGPLSMLPANELNGNGGSIPLDPQPVSIERVIMTRDYCGAYTYRNGAIERILMGNGFIQDSTYYVQVKDYQGNVRAVLDQSHNVVERNGYYAYGRRTAINDPSAGRTTYTYDAAGNVATVTDARGKVTSTTYNNYGLPTSATIGSDMTVTYYYNNYLMPTAINCSNGNSKQFTYNKYHQLTSETINGFKKSYSYSGGNVASVNYKLNGENLGTETYQRTRGTLTGITFRGKSLWQLCAEDDRGLPTSLSSGVGTASLEYDDMKRITRRIVETDYGTIHDMSYTYDTYGNLTSREDSYWGMAEDFDYDNLNSNKGPYYVIDGKGDHNTTTIDMGGQTSGGLTVRAGIEF